ncbi:hypothetical protein D9756_010614 [Leucocoprinus leucothites]|uniref:Cytochrome P450 n=1 Tax=Leucocoprinus leucothites TaxID=201217 RepID=A0A8H5FS83_9AGAR|nr:hypothetical protein D9756_010614 [Leucoagaricus leucothites]
MKVLLAILVLVALVFWNRSKKRYPPGPKHLPLLGNLLDIPRCHAYKKFTKYSKELDSDIIYVDAAGQPIIVLSSLKACNDLLSKRSNIYSDRFHQTMSFELVDCKRLFAFQPYNDEWREARRLVVKYFTGPGKTPINNCITEFVRKALLPNLLNTPDDFFTHIRNGIGGSIVSLVYGLPTQREKDPWIALADEALACMTSTCVPGKYAVDIFPFLKHIPEWFPEAQFQKEARVGREIVARYIHEPFEASKRGMAEGTTQPSFVTRCLESLAGADEQKELLIENVSSTFAAGGTDTSVTAVKNFFAVLLLFPDIQEKAQAEVDSVIGSGRLPELSDKPNMPYLRAVLKELLRWNPVAPAGLPHMTTEDDSYKGYFIPKGSIVFGNTWAIMHDESVFPEPFNFDPTRFLTPEGQLKADMDILDPETDATFGFGRRICPGIDFGLASFWLSAACILACFNIAPELDEMGTPIPPKFEYLGKEIIAHPEPFKCRITPRSKETIALIRAGYDENSRYI